MELAKKLEAQGWHLTEEGIKTLTAAVGSDEPRKIIDEALNRDLRDIGGGALPSKRDDPTLAGLIVLQVLRVRNISAPKANEESKSAPRFLQLELSDGQTSIQGLELEPVSTLSLNVAPGTKIYFRAEKLQLISGYLVLRASELQLLGGRVDALYEKWDLARTMLKYARSGRPLSGSSAPPPWVAFGKKVDSRDASERNFKSLAPSGGDKDRPAKENDEFNAMRSEAIAVASKAGGRKVFGGGGQNIMDHNIKKILDKGYTEEEAQNALAATRNNLERALYQLKRRREVEGGNYNDVPPPPRFGRPERPGRDGKRGASLRDEAELAKPAANATLFDFLTTKLPATETATAAAAAPAPPSNPSNPFTANHHSTASRPYNARAGDSERRFSSAHKPAPGMDERNRFENNISSSFAAHRGGRGGGRGNRGGRDERSHRGDRDRDREERPRGGGGGYNERAGSGYNERAGSAQPRKDYREQSNVKAAQQPQPPASKALPEAKAEQEPSTMTTTTGKDQFNNRRGSERQSNRGGAPRAENGSSSGGSSNNNNNNNNVGNNRRRQQSNNAPAAATVGGARANSNSNNNSNGNGNGNGNGTAAAAATEEFSGRLSKVIEETANLKLGAKRGEDKDKRGGKQAEKAPAATTQRQQQQQQQHNARHQPANASVSQLPNGYTYDPSKIMGFQSKETNEFAMSLLKSQGVGIADAAAALQQQQQQQQQQQSQQMMSAMPSSYYNTPAAVAATAPSTFMMAHPNPPPPPVPVPQFGMMPGDVWLWTVGDLCMAKYWDDGRYYEAEITAVSEKTCVVFFLGYGNHEEVLKLDILPLTDAQNRPLSSMSQQHPQSRFRGGDRQGQQMYVPPHKREH